MGLMSFWTGKRVLVTGHTGFKGSWLCLWLEHLGANVSGIALQPDQAPAMYGLVGDWGGQAHRICDVRDASGLTDMVKRAEPEIIFHLAAQSLVRRSYREPALTFAINVGGTVNLLDAVLSCGSVRTVVVATTDKVYAENANGAPYLESDPLGGKDPYSASKAAAEIVCESYRDSFMANAGIRLATARSGNVIGGGDWSEDRLVPDAVRAFGDGKPLALRYPEATRPWQHVLEPLGGYLAYAQALTEARHDVPSAINFGPDPRNVATVGELADELASVWGIRNGWIPAEGPHPPEARQLSLDSTLADRSLGWRSRLDRAQTIQWTCGWYKAMLSGADMRAFTIRQIAAYERLAA
ncbi:CDP-glucose 4,6-dehydratase [Ciceribacter sp. L1K22]|uniref:CDP-glucose 4,6-dehydratase n=1 Tax=Ciceribacter sp. L1K22 TaxID=2820275 RepID=UPI001ABE3839|nr:CDP-glucose 4,6-dehydratase [Ciceribacter sp. L1K22]MBO3762251.1 CDP-glucose 4,6-dehydratase [Ciceribacter sp. L1K22]